MPWLCVPTWAMYWYFIHTIAIGGSHTHKPISSWRQKSSAKSDLKTQSCSTSTQYVKMGGFFSLIPVLFWKTTTLIHHVWMDHVWSVCNLVSSFWLFSNSHDLLKQSMMSEHGLRMEPWENSECLWESTLRKQVESCDLSFFKTQNCSWNVFHAPSKCSGQEWFYFRLLPVATPQMFLCLYGKHIVAMCSLSLWLYTLWFFLTSEYKLTDALNKVETLVCLIDWLHFPRSHHHQLDW